MKPSLILPLLSALMCLFAMMPGHDYTYYMWVRLITCIAAIYCAVQMHRLQRVGLMWTMITVAILYNPILRVHLTRDLWWWINAATAVVLCLAGDKIRNDYLGR